MHPDLPPIMVRVEVAEITLPGILQVILGYIALKAASTQVLEIPGTGGYQQMSLPLPQNLYPIPLVHRERVLLLMYRRRRIFPPTILTFLLLSKGHLLTTLSPSAIQSFTTHHPMLRIRTSHLLIHHCHQCYRNLCMAIHIPTSISLTIASLRLLRIPTGMVTRVVILVLVHIVLCTHHQLCFIQFCLCMSSSIFSHHRCSNSLLPTRIPPARMLRQTWLRQVAAQGLRPRIWPCHHSLPLR